MKIKIQHKSAYGTDRYYPICEKAKLLAKFHGHKTITLHGLKLLELIGYEIEWVTPENGFTKLKAKQSST